MSENVMEHCRFYRTWKTSKGRIELLAHGYVQQSLNLGDNSTSLERAKASINAGAKAYVACGLGCTLHTWTQNDALPAEEKNTCAGVQKRLWVFAYGVCTCVRETYVSSDTKTATEERDQNQANRHALPGLSEPPPTRGGDFLLKPLAFEKSLFSEENPIGGV